MTALPWCLWLALGTAAESPGLDPAFAAWVTRSDSPTYQELTDQFLAASGRDVKRFEMLLDGLEQELRAFVASEPSSDTAASRVDLLRTFLFDRKGFQADLDLNDLENLYPDAILARKRGYCLGLSLLILVLTERLEWPVVAASAPRHTFIRYRGPDGHLNFETTLRGRAHADEWYRDRFDLTGGQRQSLRNLTVRELAAHLINNHGFVLLHLGHLDEADREFAAALGIFPGLNEAGINRGVLQARRTSFEAALAHFDRALESWPGDPYLTLNRINALESLGRDDEAVAGVTGLLTARPGFAACHTVARHLSKKLDPARDWTAIQRLSSALNASVVGEKPRLPGFRGRYYGGRQFEKLVTERADRDISFSWSWRSPMRGLPRDNFSIRWDGFLDVPEADEYTFFVTCSDGVRISVDDRRIVDAWRTANDTFTQGAVVLEPGLHQVRVEYFEGLGQAGILLLLTAEKQREALELGKVFFHVAGTGG